MPIWALHDVFDRPCLLDALEAELAIVWINFVYFFESTYGFVIMHNGQRIGRSQKALC